MVVELEKTIWGVKYSTELSKSITSLLKVTLGKDSKTEFFTYTKPIQPKYLLVKTVELTDEQARTWRPIDINPTDPDVKVYEAEEINQENLHHRGLLITERYHYRRP